MKFEVKDGKLTFEGVDMGTLEDGRVNFDIDQLRKLVISQTRFTQGPTIEGRTMEQPLKEYMKAHEEKEGLASDARDSEIHNLKRIIASLDGQLRDTNIQLNTLRKQCSLNSFYKPW